MLKIPKQIYFDQPMLELYTQYAQQQDISFGAAVRNILEANQPKVSSVRKPSFMDFYGAGKQPHQKRYTIRQERAAFMNALSGINKERKYA
jgi:hypothetical protein